MAIAVKYLTVALVALLIGGFMGRWIRPASGGQGQDRVLSDSGRTATEAIQEFAIHGMMCGGCVNNVTEALKRIPGVQAVKVSLPEKRAIVVGNPSQVTVEKVATAVADAGYKASPMPASERKTEANDYTRSVARPYKDVLAAVEQAAKAEGFRVSNVHDIAASLGKEGIRHEPYATVEVCNAKLAAQVLQADPRLGSLMPCRMAVYQQGDKTTVSMVLPSRLMTMFPEQPKVQEAAVQVDRAMKTIIDAATR